MDKAKKLLIIYLSKSSCLDFCKGLANLITEYRHEIWCQSLNTPLFKGSIALGNSSGLVASSRLVLNLVGKLFKKAVQSKTEYDILLPAFHPLNLLIAIYAKPTKNIKVHLVVHDFLTHTGEKSKLVESLQRWTMSLSAVVLFLSEHELNKALKSGYDPIKCRLIKHPFELSTNKNNLAFPASAKLLFLGRLVDYKGVNMLVEAIDGLPFETLTIAGKGAYPKEWDDHEKINIINRHISEEEYTRLSLTHHIQILPYIEASQSGVLLKAASFGIPMVISRVGGLPEQLSEASAVFCEANVPSLRMAILKLITDANLFNSVKNNVILEANKMHKQAQESIMTFVKCLGVPQQQA